MSGKFGQASNTRKSVEWYSPQWIFHELGLQFDLDPCSPHDMQTAVPARVKYTIFDNGLTSPWFGLVWLNPPYGPDVSLWMQAMLSHNNGVALVFSRTDATWFQQAMRAAQTTLFLSGRIAFVPGHENRHKKSRAGAGTALFGFGNEAATGVRRLAHRGVLFDRPANPPPHTAAIRRSMQTTLPFYELNRGHSCTH